MIQEDKGILENQIKKKIETIKNDIQAYKELVKPISPDNAIGRLTRMEAINSKGINEEALRKAKFTLLKLKHALKKIDDPEFGLCEACEESIPIARLMIMPEADLCVGCASKIK